MTEPYPLPREGCGHMAPLDVWAGAGTQHRPLRKHQTHTSGTFNTAIVDPEIPLLGSS